MKKNFGITIPKNAIPRKEEWKDYETIDELMADAKYPHNWCSGGLCACIGCVNNFVSTHGFKKEDWEEWVSRNPAPPKEKGYGFKSYTFKRKNFNQ